MNLAYLEFEDINSATRFFKQYCKFSRGTSDRADKGIWLWNMSMVLDVQGHCNQTIIQSRATLDILTQMEIPNVVILVTQLTDLEND
jgi:hypothetical protein